MNLHTIEQAVTLHPSTVVGLTAEQHKSRSHNLTNVGEGPKGTILCRIEKPVQFKAGETIYVDDLPKSLASQVVEVVEPGAVSAEVKPKKSK